MRLRNLEYDLTRTVKKVVYGFQSVDTVLAAMKDPVKLTLFVTPDTLPESLKTAPDIVAKVAKDIQAKSAGKFTFETVNPDAPNTSMNRQKLYDTYKLRPIAASLFSSESYYLDMALQIGSKAQLVAPEGDLTEASVRTAIESALKRSSTGFLKVVGLWTPTLTPTQNIFGQQQQPLQSWDQAQQQLSQDYTVRTVDLSTGQVPSDIDVLVMIAPQNLDDKALYAVDQYLMRGGAVVAAAGNFTLSLDPYAGNLALQEVQGGLGDMLSFYGISIDKSLVMDPQNEPFPVQVARQVGGTTVQEIQAINYPFFVDVRSGGMDQTSPIVSSLSAVTINWASPITLDAEKNKGRQTTGPAEVHCELLAAHRFGHPAESEPIPQRRFRGGRGKGVTQRGGVGAGQLRELLQGQAIAPGNPVAGPSRAEPGDADSCTSDRRLHRGLARHGAAGGRQ